MSTEGERGVEWVGSTETRHLREGPALERGRWCRVLAARRPARHVFSRDTALMIPNGLRRPLIETASIAVCGRQGFQTRRVRSGVDEG